LFFIYEKAGAYSTVSTDITAYKTGTKIQMDSKLILDELDRFIEKRFKHLDKSADPMAYFEENQQISRLCYEFFMTKDIFCGTREYRNGKLWTR